MHRVAVIVGSLRLESINLKLARALAKIARPQLDLQVLDLHDVPLYNEDLWAESPAGVLRLKQELEAADAVLFVTPEYNRGVPAVTKNVIDWGSRPVGHSAWLGKPAAIIGTSPGVVGTAVAQSHLRSVVTACGMQLLTQPEAYLTYKPGMIDDEFTVADSKTAEFLAKFLADFEMWISRQSNAKD